MAVIDVTFADAKTKPGKIQACKGFEPLTSVRYRSSALGHLVGSL